MAIDGVNGGVGSLLRYSRGIVVQGTGLTNVSIDHVTVRNSRLDGIVVGGANGGGGLLAVNPGVIVQNAGYTGGSNNPPPSSGLLVIGTGAVTITGGADQIAFNQNTEHGVSVTQQGSVTVNATVDVSNPTAAGYDGAPIVAMGNTVAGLSVAQATVGASTGASTVPVCNVTGFVSLRTTAGNGIRVEGGSKAKLRNCVAYGNSLSGIIVPTGAGGGGATTQDRNWTDAIDLGTNGSPGNNVVQVPGQPFGRRRAASFRTDAPASASQSRATPGTRWPRRATSWSAPRTSRSRARARRTERPWCWERPTVARRRAR